MSILNLLQLLIVDVVTMVVPLFLKRLDTFFQLILIFFTLQDYQLGKPGVGMCSSSLHLSLTFVIADFHAIRQQVVAVIIHFGHRQQEVADVHFFRITLFIDTVNRHRLDFLLKFRMCHHDTLAQYGHIFIISWEYHETIFIGLSNRSTIFQQLQFTLDEHLYR